MAWSSAVERRRQFLPPPDEHVAGEIALSCRFARLPERRGRQRSRRSLLGQECRILLQHLQLELLQVVTWVDAELVGEHGACAPKRSERVALAPRAIERQREEVPEGLAVGVQSNQLLERRDGFDVASVAHPEVPQRDFGTESQFMQARRLCFEESTRQPGVRLAAPERQRVDERPVGRFVLSCRCPLGSLCDTGRETVRIEFVRFELERVATGVSSQSCPSTRGAAERLA